MCASAGRRRPTAPADRRPDGPAISRGASPTCFQVIQFTILQTVRIHTPCLAAIERTVSARTAAARISWTRGSLSFAVGNARSSGGVCTLSVGDGTSEVAVCLSLDAGNDGAGSDADLCVKLCGSLAHCIGFADSGYKGVRSCAGGSIRLGWGWRWCSMRRFPSDSRHGVPASLRRRASRTSIGGPASRTAIDSG